LTTRRTPGDYTYLRSFRLLCAPDLRHLHSFPTRRSSDLEKCSVNFPFVQIVPRFNILSLSPLKKQGTILSKNILPKPSLASLGNSHGKLSTAITAMAAG